MTAIKKEYLKLEGSEKQLEVTISYDIGGPNFFSGGMTKRGYYGVATPVTVSDNICSYEIGSGLRMLLIECSRKNKKSESDALALWESKKHELITQVKAKMQVKANGNNISKELGVCIPPCFHHMTKDQILNMPVQIVGLKDGKSFYDTLKEAKEALNLNKLCGAMRGSVSGRDCLRFETQEAYDVLSR